MSQKWEYNGIELEVNLQDADFAEKYEYAFEQMEAEEKNLVKTGKNSEMIRGYCALFRNLFDRIYGDGTADKLFGSKHDAGMCDEAYGRFMNAALKCNQESIAKRQQIVSKYTPNREQRRAWHKNYNNKYHGKHT